MSVSLWFTLLVMSLGEIALVRILNWVDILIHNAVLENSRLILASDFGKMRSSLVGMADTILTTLLMRIGS